MAPDTGRDSGEQKAWSQRRVERSPEAGMDRLYTDRVRLGTRVGPRKVTIPALGHGKLAVERESLESRGTKILGLHSFEFGTNFTEGWRSEDVSV